MSNIAYSNLPALKYCYKNVQKDLSETRIQYQARKKLIELYQDVSSNTQDQDEENE